MNDKFLPFQVIDKDTGDVWEYESLDAAKAKYKELVKMYQDSDQEYDVRIMKVGMDGNFIKWM